VGEAGFWGRWQRRAIKNRLAAGGEEGGKEGGEISKPIPATSKELVNYGKDFPTRVAGEEKRTGGMNEETGNATTHFNLSVQVEESLTCGHTIGE